ncbi:hypothetical protein NLG97_g10776 [Lecanicillium saksenae]|uniref:Uncharacterized protein n=1 Tax=Lecanicillium saksenae TaxID=468837 RepID=A0ACC1QE21_9HYPO|nr:hypothetical protein NLG97_g10776 [Lecanicillium saksenae]
MSELNDRTFHLFPKLHPEIRLMIWEHYFTSPRLHIIEQALPVERPRTKFPPRELLTVKDGVKMQQGCFMTWTTMDATTNQVLPTRFHTDINQEARFVAKKVGRWTKIPKKQLQCPGWRPDRGDKHGSVIIRKGRIDVNWSIDVLYVYNPQSILPLLSVTRLDFTPHIQHLALAVPYTCPIRGPFGLSFPSQWLDFAPTHFEQLQTITVVTIPPKAATQRDAPIMTHAVCPRDAHGFTTVKAYHKQSEFSFNTSTLLEDTRVAGAARYQFDRHHEHGLRSRVVVKRAVDVDFLQVDDQKYARRLKL